MDNRGRQGNDQRQIVMKKSLFIFLAVASIVLAMLCLQKTSFYKRWLDEGLNEAWKFVRDFVQYSSMGIYISGLVYISFNRRSNPIRLGARVKFGIDGGFVLICLAISKYFDDLPSAILFLSLCFHVIPVAQLIFNAEDYGIFDTLLALCIETTMHLHKYQKVAPLVVIVLSFGMQAVKHYSAAVGREGRAQTRDVEMLRIEDVEPRN